MLEDISKNLLTLFSGHCRPNSFQRKRQLIVPAFSFLLCNFLKDVAAYPQKLVVDDNQKGSSNNLVFPRGVVQTLPVLRHFQ